MFWSHSLPSCHSGFLKSNSPVNFHDTDRCIVFIPFGTPPDVVVHRYEMHILKTEHVYCSCLLFFMYYFLFLMLVDLYVFLSECFIGLSFAHTFGDIHGVSQYGFLTSPVTLVLFIVSFLLVLCCQDSCGGRESVWHATKNCSQLKRRMLRLCAQPFSCQCAPIVFMWKIITKHYRTSLVIKKKVSTYIEPNGVYLSVLLNFAHFGFPQNFVCSKCVQ